MSILLSVPALQDKLVEEIQIARKNFYAVKGDNKILAGRGQDKDLGIFYRLIQDIFNFGDYNQFLVSKPIILPNTIYADQKKEEHGIIIPPFMLGPLVSADLRCGSFQFKQKDAKASMPINPPNPNPKITFPEIKDPAKQDDFIKLFRTYLKELYNIRLFQGKVALTNVYQLDSCKKLLDFESVNVSGVQTSYGKQTRDIYKEGILLFGGARKRKEMQFQDAESAARKATTQIQVAEREVADKLDEIVESEPVQDIKQKLDDFLQAVKERGGFIEIAKTFVSQQGTKMPTLFMPIVTSIIVYLQSWQSMVSYLTLSIAILVLVYWQIKYLFERFIQHWKVNLDIQKLREMWN